MEGVQQYAGAEYYKADFEYRCGSYYFGIIEWIDFFKVEKGTGLLYNSTKYTGCIDIILVSLGGKNGEVEYKGTWYMYFELKQLLEIYDETLALI